MNESPEMVQRNCGPMMTNRIADGNGDSSSREKARRLDRTANSIVREIDCNAMDGEL
jgi:hypothetical protein